jgi:hypothetical protein
MGWMSSQGLIGSVINTSPLLVCSCGVELPVSAEAVAEAGKHVWYDVNRRFNRVFYSVMRGAGVDGKVAKDHITLLAQHKQHIGLSPRQVRGAYGLQVGVFGRTGDFLVDAIDGQEVQVALMDDSDRKGWVTSFSETEFPMVEEDALRACASKPDQVDIQAEFRWVVSKMREWPDFEAAPSQSAIKMWLAVNDPKGIDPAVRDLMNMAWTKRLSPGDKGGKGKAVSAFAEDKVVEDDAEYLADLNKRLWGK